MTREEKQKAIDALKISAPIMAVTQEEFNDYIRTLNKVMDWLEQEPSNSENPNKSEILTGSTTKNDLGVDCISKIEVIDYLCKHCPDDGECFKDCDEIKHLRQMPSVTPQLRKGHWITKPHVYGVTYCSECGFELKIDNTNYCPNCGAKMVEPQESEET